MNASKLSEILASEHALGKLYSHFPTKDAALRFYAECMARSYAPTSAGENCIVCAANTRSDQVYRYEWEAEFDHRFKHIWVSTIFAMLGHFLTYLHLANKHRKVGFSTYHRLCANCAGKYNRRFISAGVLIFPGVLAAAAGLFCFSLCLMVPFVVIPSDWLLAIVSFAAGGTLCCGIAFFCWKLWTKGIIPPKLRFIAKDPFRLRQVQRLRQPVG